MREIPESLMRYFEKIEEEHKRIGFTDEELAHLAPRDDITEEMLVAELQRLAAIPSGIGANAYYASLGADISHLRDSIEDTRRRKRG